MNEWFPIHPGEVIAGVFGGALRAIARRDLGGWQIVSSLIAGAICAGYATPLGTEALAKYGGIVLADRPHATAAFLVGLGGLSIAQGLLTFISRWWEKKADDLNGGPRP